MGNVMNQQQTDNKSVTYEIFMGILSILSIVNLVLFFAIPSENVSAVIAIMDSLLTVIFASDFVYRLGTAKSKSDYFFRNYGWADLLGSMPIPQLKILRTFRVLRVTQLLRTYGLTGFFKEFLANRARSALLTLLLFVILLIEFGGMAILSVEQHAANATIKTGGDAVWYTFVTITTVGYGDTYPVTHSGRLIGMLIMAVGVALFGTLTGFLSSAFLGESDDTVPDAPESESEPASGSELDSAQAASSQLAELKRMLADQQKMQAALTQKIAEVEALL